ncbi:hypothetical protein SJAV_26600 [Sulfurisphaera javensis]|uniref:CRISPR-associated protein Cas5 n=1 Tax=Sulfurisphaera javensis TaxID=2049879 RepID=A0AAT9GVF6_9CREN
MNLYSATLRVYGWYDKEIIPSTTIAGSIAYGIFLNKTKLEGNVMFSNFELVNKFKITNSRIKNNRVINETEPFIIKRYAEKGLNYSIYKGYIIADDTVDIAELNKYLLFLGNNFTFSYIDDVAKIEPKTINNLCVYNILTNYDGVMSLLREAKEVRIEIQRFANMNYMTPPSQVYYFDMNDKKFKPYEVSKLHLNDKLYLVSFSPSKLSLGSYYDQVGVKDFPEDDVISFYLKSGTGVVAPCLDLEREKFT